MTPHRKASSIKHSSASGTTSKVAAVALVSMITVLTACGGGSADEEADAAGSGSVVGSSPVTTSKTSVVDLPTTNVPVSIYEDKVISNAEAASLVGMTEAAALREVQARGWRVRVVGRDGEMYAMTMDYSAGRLNFTITNGVITACTVG
jgi:hypothetical protein